MFLPKTAWPPTSKSGASANSATPAYLVKK